MAAFVVANKSNTQDGELTSDPKKLVDSEGAEMSFNKVDKALKSVGISMQTAEGQFRNFDDVIVELADKWKDLSSVQQRYIATQFARQGDNWRIKTS